MNNNRIRGMKKICKMLAILMTANLISACLPFIENPVDDMDVVVTGITITGPLSPLGSGTFLTLPQCFT